MENPHGIAAAAADTRHECACYDRRKTWAIGGFSRSARPAMTRMNAKAPAAMRTWATAQTISTQTGMRRIGRQRARLDFLARAPARVHNVPAGVFCGAGGIARPALGRALPKAGGAAGRTAKIRPFPQAASPGRALGAISRCERRRCVPALRRHGCTRKRATGSGDGLAPARPRPRPSPRRPLRNA